MRANRCPNCGKTAMSLWSKFAASSLSCVHCHQSLRLWLLPTAAAGLVVYISILSAGLYFGVNRTSIFFALCCLLIFLLICLFMPLEINNKKSK